MTRIIDDATLTRRLAQGTGEILKGVRNVGLLRGRNLGKAGDSLAQDWISRCITEHRPDDAFLSEEAADNRERLDNNRVWIVDPLDGTKEFAGGRQDWAVHIALVEDHQVKYAAVGLPDIGHVFHSDDARAVQGPRTHRLVVSHNKTPAISKDIAAAIDSEVVAMGSCGAKAMSVLLGDHDAYIHAGGQYEWDNAAPVGVCQAAGLHCSRLDGSPLSYNNPDTYLPDLVICRPELAEDIIAAAQAFAAEYGSYAPTK